VTQAIARVPARQLPWLVAAAGERAGTRFLEFFAANIRNPHTRRAYARAADEFLARRVKPYLSGGMRTRLQHSWHRTYKKDA
jgi:hypothetical protein